MRNTMKRIASVVLCGALMIPSVWADAPGDRNGQRQRTTTQNTQRKSSGQRQGANQRPTGSRQGNRTAQPSQNQGNSINRPGQSNNAGQQNKNNGQRPGAGQSSSNHAPGMPDGPVVSPNGRPGSQPGHNSGSFAPQTGRPGNFGNPPQTPRPNIQPGQIPPPRPPRNPFYVYMAPPRPTPPPTWVMPVRPLSFGQALLGLTFGAALNASLNYFYGNGFTVGGYTGNAIYLNNVEMMNFLWPETSVFYNAAGLASTVYTYSTGYNDPARYNSLLSQLTLSYGTPYITRGNSGMTAQWWGPSGNYVALQYQPTFSSTGAFRFYTTLTFGN